MFAYRWLLISLIEYSTLSFRLQCPDISQRQLRASAYCTKGLRSKYTCLYDTNSLSFSEQCNRNPDFVTPGEKYVLSGNLRNVDCSSELYQPFRLWSNVSGECLFQKSLCVGEGQIVFNNGSLIEERTCRCDYTKGYKFIKQPKLNCSCRPSEEDCSCHISKCPDDSVLSPDYECVEDKRHADWKCPPIEIESGSMQTTRNRRSYTEKLKQLRIILIAVSVLLVLILTYTVIVFVFWDRIREITNKTDISKSVKQKRKPSAKSNGEETSTLTSTLTHVVVKKNTTENVLGPQTEIKEQGSVRRESNESVQREFNVQCDSKDATIKKKESQLDEIIKSKDTEIEKLRNLLEQNKKEMKEKDKEMKEIIKEVEHKDEQIKNRDKMIEEKEKDSSKEIKEKNLRIMRLETDRKDLHNQIQDLKGNIRVFCRVRPFLTKEIHGSGFQIKHITFPYENTLEIVAPDREKKKIVEKEFRFDKVFNTYATQRQVFEEISQLVQSALDGYNVCIFACGQTGSGKTYTMEGMSITNDNDENRGMIPRSVQQIFDTIKKLKNEGWNFHVDVSCLEIYGKRIHDLLCYVKVGSKETPKDIPVAELTVKRVTNEQEVYSLLQKASNNRAVAKTESNERSSRSHSVFKLKLMGEHSTTKATRHSILNLVDLAGSERQKKSKAEGKQLQEASGINNSLTVLGRVIRAITNNEKLIPYRDSTLTLVLKSSIGGNSKTLMFLNISPREDCVDETLNSLRFATEVNECNIGTAQQNK